MKPGDLVLIPATAAFNRKGNTIALLVSTRISKWGSEYKFHTVITDRGVEEVLQHKVNWKVVSKKGIL